MSACTFDICLRNRKNGLRNQKTDNDLTIKKDHPERQPLQIIQSIYLFIQQS